MHKLLDLYADIKWSVLYACLWRFYRPVLNTNFANDEQTKRKKPLNAILQNYLWVQVFCWCKT